VLAAKDKVFCATGHRPNKLGGYSKEVSGMLIKVALDFLEESKPHKIISGMALGWDLAWAQAGIIAGIPVEAAIPFVGQEGKWPKISQDYYTNLLDACSVVTVVCEGGYSPYKMQVRNEYMVDNSSLVVALWDGTAGGTGNCVRYAEAKGASVVNLWGRYESIRRK
jgi:uncharacterized phage-like protein YoqJ